MDSLEIYRKVFVKMYNRIINPKQCIMIVFDVLLLYNFIRQ
jgi:hypothetical protein